MIDAQQLKDDGYDLGAIAGLAERAMTGLIGCTSSEADWIRGELEMIRDECELNH